MKKTVLSIAGSDPTGGAGIQQDLKVMHAFGVHGMAVPAALTAQNSAGVEAVEEVGAAFVRKQLDTLLSDIRPDAVKLGMLYTADVVAVVVDAIERYGLVNVVVDPVSVSTSGRALVQPEAFDALRERLVPRAAVVTPNIHEAARLTGTHIEGEQNMEAAAAAVRAMGPDAVVVTGGHLDALTLDVYCGADGVHRLQGVKDEGEFHGTGCAFSTALACSLALDEGILDAARRAKQFVHDAIRAGFKPGGGMMFLDI